MIKTDLHTHTLYSHGKDTPQAMWGSAQQKGITLLGFSEHSPRPQNYTYTHEYREQLTKFFPQYIAEVQELKSQFPNQVLLGMEMDWIEKELDFIQKAINAYDFDYLIGSVHFLQNWGYDDDPKDWIGLDASDHAKHYEAYFKTLTKMAQSGLFNIAAHLDLIKIFSIDAFMTWIKTSQAMNSIGESLEAIKQSNMALEISSAGLRKPCKQIYPCPEILGLASELGLEISFASDAHNVQDVGADFDVLEKYAKSYGYTHSVYYCQGTQYSLEF